MTTTHLLQRTLVLALCLAAMAWTTLAPAGVIVKEPFEYELGILLNSSANGGVGWAGGWETTAENVYCSNALTYTDWDATGNGACAASNSGNKGRPFDATGYGTDGSVNWYSALIWINGANSGQRIGFFSTAAGSSGSGVGFGVQTGAPAGQFYLRAGVGGGGATFVTGSNSQPLDLTNVCLVIGKVTWSDTTGSDINQIWVNPADWSSQSALGTPSSEITNEATAVFTATAGAYVRSTTVPDMYADELRLGTDLTDVIPNPSPVAKPTNVSPVGGADQVPLTATLEGSPFSSTDVGDAHTETEFQIRSGLGTVTILTSALTSIQVHLQPSRHYSWQLRYKGSATTYWSPPSVETAFTTVYESTGALIAYDGAVYNPTNTIDRFNGGTGWLDVWDEQGSGSSRSLMGVEADGLVYTDSMMYALLCLSNRFVTEQVQLDTATSSVSRAWRTMQRDGFLQLISPSNLYGRAYTTNWVSCLVRLEESSPTSTFGIGFVNTAWDAMVLFGKPLLSDFWGIVTSNGMMEASTVAVQSNETVFLLGSVAHDGTYCSAHLWINPPLAVQPVVGDAVSLYGIPDFGFAKISFGSADSDPANANPRVSFDEVRFGDGWQSVMPNELTPEPAMLLIVLAAGAVCMRRRRQAL